VLEEITNADVLVIMGPGEAQLELLGRMARISGVRARVLQTEKQPHGCPMGRSWLV
jgi:hypothetical protein